MSEVNINYKGSNIATMDASGTKTLLTDGKYCEDDIEVVYTRPSASLQSKSKSYTPSETAQSETVTADSGYDGLGQVSVSVDAVSPTYVGSEITRRSILLFDYDSVITAKSGYYPEDVTRTLPTQDLQIFYPSTSDQVLQGNVWVNGNQYFKAVTTSNLTAANIKEGVTVTIGDAAVADRVLSVTGTYSGGGGPSKNVQVVQSTTRTNASTLTAIGAELTVSTTGTYDIYYSCFRTNTSSSYTWATRLYINGTAYGTAENATWTNNQQNTHLSNISLTVGDKLRVYGRNTRGTSYYICAPTLAIVEA